MLLDQIALRFKKLSQHQKLEYSMAGPASETDISQVEKRLDISFPEQVRAFYLRYNGLRVTDPHLEILSLEQLEFISANFLHFAILNQGIKLCFDVSKTNDANQWDIVSIDGFRVTLTMASFWSNCMWSWIEKGRAIWLPEDAT